MKVNSFLVFRFDGFSESDIICFTKQQYHSRRISITLDLVLKGRKCNVGES